MSKHETPMIELYWRQIGGTLVEEYYAVRRCPTCGPRRIDAIILPRGLREKLSWREVSLAGQEVIVVQAKAGRLGMDLMGQALFSMDLVKRLNPSSVRSVALCGKDDSVLRPLLERHGVEVVVIDMKTRRFLGPPFRRVTVRKA